MSVAFLTLSFSCFFLMRGYFEKATSDLLKVWLNTEQVSLDQGNYISSFSKLQRSIYKDSYIKGFVVKDSDGREVFSTGRIFPVKSVNYNNHQFVVVDRGFFSTAQQAQFANLRMTVFSSSVELMYTYLLIVGYFVILSLVFAYFVKKIAAREEQIKTENEMNRLNEIVNINEALSNQAKQVAHDIRSPLSVLNLIVPQFADDSNERMVLVQQAVDRINSIAADLLNKRVTKSDSEDKCNASKIIEKIVSEKRVALRENIFLKNEATNFDVIINMSSLELERILSNLINNSIEAMGDNGGHITCVLQQDINFHDIVVKDNGKGIPEHLFDKIGQRGVSFGKEKNYSSGSGLGLFHAKQTLEKNGARLLISSALSVGTTITLRFPKI